MNAFIARNWVRVGIGAGLVACVTYPLLVLVPMPRFLTAIVLSAFGPSLGFASVGLYYFLKLHRDSVVAQIAALSNLLAGALVTTMLMVQTSIKFHAQDYFAGPAPDESIRTTVFWMRDVDLGIDVAWDVYIGLGTLLFGVAALRHPRLGRVVGWAGILIAGVGVLGFNLYTHPTPPADAGLIDAGPLCGLWYLVVVILIWRSRAWVEEQLAEGASGAR